MTTYDLSKIATDTFLNEPYTKKIGEEKISLTLRDIIVQAFKIRVTEDKLSDEEVNFNRKIVKKLQSAEDLTAIPLKSKAISAIRARFKHPLYPHDITYQILDALDGQPTQAELDEV
jgi:hypothetical protein